MWCFVSESPSVVREYRLPKASLGVTLLDKVCEDLGLLEKDYFGLRVRSLHGELLWLNLRNPIGCQLRGKSPRRLSLQVKFFVSPQELQQPITRHVYYLTLKNRLLLGHFIVDDETKTDLLALVSQAELGIADQALPTQYAAILPDLTDSQVEAVQEAHRILAGTITPTYSEIQLIARVSQLAGYGVEYFPADTMDRQKVVIGVFAEGLQILSEQRELMHRIKFEDISKVSYHQNRFSVHYYTSLSLACHDYVMSCLKFRLTTRKVAQALFRAFTENHTFFRCENVERVVRQQHSHTGWGSLVVLIRPDTSFGKMYRFDVVHTRRQAYECAWRKLHPDSSPPVQHQYSQDIDGRYNTVSYSTQTLRSTHSQEIMLSRQPSRASEMRLPQIKSHSSRDVNNSEDESTPEGTMNAKDKSKDGTSSSDGVEAELVVSLQDQLSSMRDSRLCQVCLEREMGTVFCPCGHMICCEQCAQECVKCPICRAEVSYVQRVFFS
ncbi:LOW QUALITY PROTEIN: E3 ubiquitin-protein ligase MYLIP-like [Amphiura filiformis]|uniref:LOW QUALITY PROTEIN: E3 ubiquitin-protein ligase MYLIP-like n=1 Tax=Amphiura filiformis TaxID=82378 RepID=UPI003B20BDEF